MARIAGVDLPARKRAAIGLTYIYGIGRTRALSLLHRAQVDPDKKISDLSEEEVNHLRNLIEGEGAIEGDLRKEVSMNVKRLMEMGSYRGLRHTPMPARARVHARVPSRTRRRRQPRRNFRRSDARWRKHPLKQRLRRSPSRRRKRRTSLMGPCIFRHLLTTRS